MSKRFSTLGLILLLVIGAAGPTSAQDSTPPQVREAAINAAQAVLGTRADSWEYDILDQTTAGNLGCPIVPAGDPLPAPVTPYRVELTYPDGIYVVYVSADGTRVQLCDSKFGEAGQPDDTEQPGATCQITALGPVTLYEVPDFNAPTVSGDFGVGDTTTAIGRTNESGFYQIAIEDGVAWVPSGTIQLGDNCGSLPVTAITSPDAVTTACFVSSAGPFANIRARPTTESEQVTQINEGSSWQVYGRNSEGTWYYITPGWVALTVVNVSGDCAGVPINDNLLGRGDETTGGGPLEEGGSLSTSQILDLYSCPPGFDPYLTPRITIGNATARVEQGGAPNRLRAQPTTNEAAGTFVGQAQPGRTLDRVINGPVCNESYVWWLVEIDGVTGWTAESDYSQDTYYLQPIGQAAAPTPAPPSDFSSVQSYGIDVADGSTRFMFAPDGTLVVASDNGTTLTFYNAQTGTVGEQAITLPFPLVDMTFTPEGRLVTIDTGGTVRYWNQNSGLQIGAIESGDSGAFNGPIDLNPNGTLLVTVGCNTPDTTGNCTQGLVSLWDAVEGQAVRLQPAHPDVPDFAVFSPDGNRIASAGSDGVQVWDVQSGAFVGAVAFPADDPFAAGLPYFSQDSNEVFYSACADLSGSTCNEGRIAAYSIAADAPARDYTGFQGAVTLSAISADGVRLAAVSSGVIQVYDLATGQNLFTLPGDGVDLALSPDGGLVATLTPQPGTITVYVLDGGVG